MKKNIFIIALILSSLRVFSQVNNGDPIKADKFNSSVFNVGDVKQALLTQAQFQALNGNCWVMMSGQSVAGSDFAQLTGITTLPNASGKFLRTAGGNAAPLAQEQMDAFQGHRHNWMLGQSAGTAAPFGGMWGANNSNYNAYVSRPNGGEAATSSFGDARVSSETRPVNVTVNTFIKINNNCTFN